MFKLKQIIAQLFGSNDKGMGINIDDIIKELQSIELNDSDNRQLNAMEIADILWLTRYYQFDKTKSHYKPKSKSIKDKRPQEPKPKDTPPKDKPKPPPPKKEETSKSPTDTQAKLELSGTSMHPQSTIDIPRDSYLDNARNIAKYLRHFKQKVPSRRRTIFDEDKTVEHIAHTALAYPFFKPQKTKRFRLYLLIDDSSKMEIWQEIIDEYTKLLSNAIVFREVITIYFDADKTPSQWYRNKKNKSSFHYKSITNYHQDKLIFVLSDMVAPAWYKGDILTILNELYKSIPLYMIQLLPYRKWHTTRLSKAPITKLRTSYPYPTHQSYQSDMDRIVQQLGGDVFKLPLAYLDLEYLRVIGASLQAKKDNQIDGAMLQWQSMPPQMLKKRSPLEELEYFLSASSQKAQTLLKSFAAVPLNMPIMRMVQKNTIGDSFTIYLAEVLNSGLLHEKDTFYYLHEDVQDRLLKYLTKKERLTILYQNADYIQGILHSKYSFKALLAGTMSVEEFDKLEDNDRLFAVIACKVLQTLGKEYALKAGCIQRGVKNEPKNIIPKSKTFLMGSNEDDEEKPIYAVTINYDFEIAKYPVTVGEYMLFVNETKSHYPEWMEEGSKYSDDHYKGICLKDNCPIVGISWNDAVAYCAWLSKKTGEAYRLPTEAEWEYVARAGTTTKWSFGDDEKELEKYAWYDEKGGKGAKEVGTKKANPWGLHDMHGNVWEWCEDWYVDSYKDTPRDGSANEKGEKKYRVLRGGSCGSFATDTRSFVRDWYNPISRYKDVGFRLLRVLPSS